jgi:hypothetical protein
MNEWNFQPDENGHIRIYWMKMSFGKKKITHKIEVQADEGMEDIVEEFVRLLTED